VKRGCIDLWERRWPRKGGMVIGQLGPKLKGKNKVSKRMKGRVGNA